MAIGARELVAVAIGMGLAAAVSWAREWFSRGLRIEITVSSSRCEVGQTTEVLVEAVNERARRSPSLWGVLRAQDAHDREPVTVPVRIPSLAPGQRHRGRVIRRSLPRRGRFALDVVVTDPLGLASWALALRHEAVLWVHPFVHRPVVAPLGGAVDDGTMAAGGLSGGEVFQYVREYVPGDDVRLIHWRASAAHGLDRGVPWPFVRHQVVAEDPELVVVLDTTRSSYGPDADVAFEDAVRATATIMDAAAERGGTVRLAVGCGGDAIVLARGGLTEALDWLAEVSCAPEGVAPLSRLRGAVPEGTSAVLVTGSAAEGTSAVAIALRDLGVRSVAKVHLGGRQAPPSLGADDHWFATSWDMARQWRPVGEPDA